MTECTRCRRQYSDGVHFCPVDGFAAVPVSDPNLGRQLMGQFQLVAACGRGATGTVYRALQSGMDRQVAVKLLRADLLQDPTVVKRFVREARAGARLGHPSIATVHLVGQTDDGVPYIVMEYVEGVPLSALLSDGRVPPVRILHIAEQIASALAEAHDKGIIHRDLKPENILLSERRGDRDVVKVVDFGIAKIVADHYNSDSQLSRIGTVFGTPHYIAPEQASGVEIDHRVDLYSLGCILFQMATGRVPFEGASGIQVLLRHLREEPPNPRALVPQLPEALAQLILELLRKDPTERPADGEAVLLRIRALREALRSLPQPPAMTTAEAAFERLAGPIVPALRTEITPVPQTVSALAAAPGEGEEPDEAELALIMPWWRRRVGAFVGGAVLLGLLAGVIWARRAYLYGAALSSVPAGAPLASPAVLASPPLSSSKLPAAASPALAPPKLVPRTVPTPANKPPPSRRVEKEPKDDELPVVHFPSNHPALPPAQQTTPQAVTPQPEPAPAAVPAPPPTLAPAPAAPPVTIAPASPVPPGPMPVDPPKAPPREEEDPSQDPYHMLK